MSTSLIRILPEALANKIAAGEVVERPASVVKELVENAIDAKADQIRIIIKNAGKSSIQIIDNGLGMSEDDALLAFERHATSKVINFSDLEKIKTMGFRGEALPSIAAVSQLELITRQEGSSLAQKVTLDGGVVENVTKTNAETGSSITVKNLFFNVPARKNFLKTNATEFSHILTVLKRFFLANPKIRFIFYSENEKVFDLEKGSVEKRIQDVLGKSFFTGLLSVAEQLGDIHLSGYVLKPDLCRQSKGQQFLFINNRMISSKYLHHAISNAYGHKIEKSQYPGYCLYLSIDPSMIDINVHPTKMDIRFTNDQMMYNFFRTSIQKALNVDEVVPEMPESKLNEIRSQPREEKLADNVISLDDLQFRPKQSFGVSHKKRFDAVPNQARLTFRYKSKDEIVDERLNQTKMEELPSAENPIDGNTEQQALWQIHNRYILSQIKSGLVIVDQHVAHERILYERILDTLHGNRHYHSQQLLFPQTLDLSRDDFSYFQELEEMLNKIGYSVKAFGGTSVVIEAIPGDIKIGNEVQSLLEIIDYHKENLKQKRNPIDRMAAAFSCRNAIKSGEKLNQKEMQSLIDQLFATSTPYFCPHGRPVIVTMSLQELDKKFKRI